MLKEMLECLKLEDEGEQESLEKYDLRKGFIMWKTLFRFILACAYIFIASILPIYIISGNEYHMRDIYKELLINVSWDEIFLMNLIVIVALSISECLGELSEKRKVKIICTILSVLLFLVSGLTVFLPMSVYGRIALINGQSIEIEHGMIIISFSFLIVGLPIITRIVMKINSKIFSCWSRDDEELRKMECWLIWLVEIICAFAIIREIFAKAVSIML